MGTCLSACSHLFQSFRMTETSTLLSILSLISNPGHAKINFLGSTTQSLCENFKNL